MRRMSLQKIDNKELQWPSRQIHFFNHQFCFQKYSDKKSDFKESQSTITNISEMSRTFTNLIISRALYRREDMQKRFNQVGFWNCRMKGFGISPQC